MIAISFKDYGYLYLKKRIVTLEVMSGVPRKYSTTFRDVEPPYGLNSAGDISGKNIFRTVEHDKNSVSGIVDVCLL